MPTRSFFRALLTLGVAVVAACSGTAASAPPADAGPEAGADVVDATVPSDASEDVARPDVPPTPDAPSIDARADATPTDVSDVPPVDAPPDAAPNVTPDAVPGDGAVTASCAADTDCAWGEIEHEILASADCMCLFGCPSIIQNRATLDRREAQYRALCTPGRDGAGRPCPKDDCVTPPPLACRGGVCQMR